MGEGKFIALFFIGIAASIALGIAFSSVFAGIVHFGWWFLTTIYLDIKEAKS